MNQLFFVISALSLFVVAYSIYQQYFKIKQWCPLCLGTAVILVLQFIVAFSVYKMAVFNYNDILLFGSVLGFVTIGWLSIKPLLPLEQKNFTLKVENLSFRRNHKLFVPYYNSLNQI